MDEKSQQQIDALTANVATLTQSIQEKVLPQLQVLSQLQAQVADLTNEREAQKAQIAAQQTAEQRAQERQELLHDLTALIQQTTTEVVAKSINPSGQPPRRTVPLVQLAAQANTSDPAQQSNLLQLSRLEGNLEGLRQSGNVDGVQEMRLLDQIKELRTQLQVQ